MKQENAIIAEVQDEWMVISYKITIAEIDKKEYFEEEPICALVHLINPNLNNILREESKRIPVTILK